MLRHVLFLILFTFYSIGHADSVMVDTAWLKKHMNDDDIVIIDMTSDDLQYMRYHIPGAIRLSYSDIVTRRKADKVAVRLPDGMLEKILGTIGITEKLHIIIYDDTGGLEAGRLFWELERIGHKKISVLDGGLVQWVLEGNKVDNNPARRRPAKYTSSSDGRDNEADREAVRKASDTDSAILLDVRSKEEYAGHPKYPRSGHIPNARWLEWETNVDFENGFKLKSETQLHANLAAVGVTDQKAPIVVYCRSGHRASQSYLTLRKLGFENVRLYDGSMAEYELDKSAPLTRGAPVK